MCMCLYQQIDRQTTDRQTAAAAAAAAAAAEAQKERQRQRQRRKEGQRPVLSLINNALMLYHVESLRLGRIQLRSIHPLMNVELTYTYTSLYNIII